MRVGDETCGVWESEFAATPSDLWPQWFVFLDALEARLAAKENWAGRARHHAACVARTRHLLEQNPELMGEHKSWSQWKKAHNVEACKEFYSAHIEGTPLAERDPYELRAKEEVDKAFATWSKHQVPSLLDLGLPFSCGVRPYPGVEEIDILVDLLRVHLGSPSAIL